MSRELTTKPDWKFCPVVLQLAWPFSSLACFTRVPPLATRQSWDPVASLFLSAHSWAFLHTLSHTTLTWFLPKYRVSKCWITSKFGTEYNQQNDWINSTLHYCMLNLDSLLSLFKLCATPKKKSVYTTLKKVVGNLLVCQACIRLIVSFKNMQKAVVNLLLCQACIWLIVSFKSKHNLWTKFNSKSVWRKKRFHPLCDY